MESFPRSSTHASFHDLSAAASNCSPSPCYPLYQARLLRSSCAAAPQPQLPRTSDTALLRRVRMKCSSCRTTTSLLPRPHPPPRLDRCDITSHTPASILAQQQRQQLQARNWRWPLITGLCYLQPRLRLQSPPQFRKSYCQSSRPVQEAILIARPMLTNSSSVCGRSSVNILERWWCTILRRTSLLFTRTTRRC